MERIALISHIVLFSAALMAQTSDNKQVQYTAIYDFVAIKDTHNGVFDQPREFILLHLENESRFHALNRQFNDSMSYVYQQAYPQYTQPQTQAEAQEALNHFTSQMSQWKKSVPIDYIVRKDFAAQKFQNVLSLAWISQHMEEPLALDWRFSEEQDSIIGLLCQAASATYGGRKYKAWFAVDIPIPDGPYVFSGLPGLIVRVADSQGWFTFQLKRISVKPETRFWKTDYINPKSKLINRETYVNQSVAYKNNPRIPNLTDVPESKILEKREQYKSKYFLLLERY